VQYLDANGRLITESLTDYSRKTVLKAYSSLSEFLTVWNDAERKQAILDELAGQGEFLEELAEQVGRDYDAFDLLCHVAFARPPATAQEQLPRHGGADKVEKGNGFAQCGAQPRVGLAARLEKYADAGITSGESLDILRVSPRPGLCPPV